MVSLLTKYIVCLLVWSKFVCVCTCVYVCACVSKKERTEACKIMTDMVIIQTQRRKNHTIYQNIKFVLQKSKKLNKDRKKTP